MNKELWLWGPLFSTSIEKAKNQRARLDYEPQHVAVDGGVLAKSHYHESISNHSDWVAIGDGDSSDPTKMDIVFEQDKSKSDLTLALEYIQKKHPQEYVRAFGFSGGRADHQIMAMGCFQRFVSASKASQVIIDEQWLVLGPGNWQGKLEPSTVSIVAFDKQEVSLSGDWKWQLETTKVNALDDLLLSNCVNGDKIEIKCSKSIALWCEKPILNWWQQNG